MTTWGLIGFNASFDQYKAKLHGGSSCVQYNRLVYKSIDLENYHVKVERKGRHR